MARHNRTRKFNHWDTRWVSRGHGTQERLPMRPRAHDYRTYTDAQGDTQSGRMVVSPVTGDYVYNVPGNDSILPPNVRKTRHGILA